MHVWAEFLNCSYTVYSIQYIRRLYSVMVFIVDSSVPDPVGLGIFYFGSARVGSGSLPDSEGKKLTTKIGKSE